MGGFELSGLKGKDKIRAKTTSDMALEVIKKSVSCCDTKLMTEWLGSSLLFVDERIYTKRIYSFMKKVTIKFYRRNGPGMALCNYRKYLFGSDALKTQTKFGDDYEAIWKSKCLMGLENAFFDKSWSEGECVVSILHELSHLALCTIDARGNFKSGSRIITDDSYGADFCTQLQSSEKFKNAENWGYYLASYRKHLETKWSNDQSKYLTKEECAKVRGTRTVQFIM